MEHHKCVTQNGPTMNTTDISGQQNTNPDYTVAEKSDIEKSFSCKISKNNIHELGPAIMECIFS